VNQAADIRRRYSEEISGESALFSVGLTRTARQLQNAASTWQAQES